IKDIALNWRVLLLAFVIILSIYVISPHPGNEGVSIRSVALDSPAEMAGFLNPTERTRQVELERILEINNQPITDIQSYFEVIDSTVGTLTIRTNQGMYTIENATGEDIGLQVANAFRTNIQTGMDLQGGTRLLIVPDEEITAEQFEDLRDNLERRLNPNGILDVRVTTIRETAFAQTPSFISIEVAGISSDEIERIVLRQGNFEARILNQTVYDGSGIAVVHSGSRQAGIERCDRRDGEVVCRFTFPITLTTQAAQSMAAATSQLDIIGSRVDGSLSEPIELYLDGHLMDSLSIAASLHGRATTDISISGSGTGPSEAAARENALANMRDLQTILKTGSLPSQISIVKSDTISPTLGTVFLQNAIFIGFLAAIVVSLLVILRYRTIAYAIPMIIISLSEVVILLGLSVIINWNIDLASIAGIIIILGSGFDHLIILTDETLQSRLDKQESWKRKFRKALFIILTAYFTTVAALLPLGWAGAGILRGFAFTTIAGLTIAILLTRPTYAKILEILSK
ncbi:MAG: hypothetical protein ACMXYA_02160, partial [Candidatus Woesearchaeota archaeon]